MLLQNILAQLSAGFLGILAGSLVATFAEEELEQYEAIIRRSTEGIFIATFLVPIFFIETKVPLVILALSYGTLTCFYKKEKKIFILLAPILLFLTTSNKEAFALTLSLFFVAIMLSTVLLLTPFVRKKELHWSKETIRTLAHTFWIFFVMSSILYGIIFVL